MAKLLPGLRSLFRLSGGVKDRATATALRSIEDWAEQLVRRLAALEESTGSGGVPTTRTISTTAPLSGGGDLSANRTLSVSTFGAADSGVVPASGGGTSNFLRSDGTWTTPSVAAAQFGLFGTGRDGAQDFDGSSAVLGVSPASDTVGSVAVMSYTMNRDWYLADGSTISDGVAILTNGWRLFVKGELVTPVSGMAYIGNWGRNGADGTPTGGGAGGTARATAIFYGGAAGGNGGNTSTGQGTAGAAALNAPRDFANASGGTGANGAPGNPGVDGRGGGGGSNVSGAGGSPSGTVSDAAISAGDIDNIQQAMVGQFVASTTTPFRSGSGGGGGRGEQNAPNVGGGGGGGASGAPTFIAIETLSDAATLTITVQGGNGGAGSNGGGGGGGGAGGWIGVALGQSTQPTISVAGGAGGTAGASGGFAGGDGGSGAAKVFIFA